MKLPAETDNPEKGTRRMGPAGSANWHVMLDGAEGILREQGYACLSSRAVAERIGVKQRLVYYYFGTMDDLIVATFRRLAERERERQLAAAASSQPLRQVWDVCIHTTDSRLISEFMALANRIPELRHEVVSFIETSRQLQVEVLKLALERSGQCSAIAPAGLALLAMSSALSMIREGELGIGSGHGELNAAIEAFLNLVEPA